MRLQHLSAWGAMLCRRATCSGRAKSTVKVTGNATSTVLVLDAAA